MIDHYDNSLVYITVSRGDLVRSSDGGSSWQTVNRFNDKIRKIVINPKDSRQIFIATDKKGVHKTNDGGENWSRMVELDNAIMAKPSDPSTPSESILALKSNANADAFPFKTNDFQMMQSAVAEVAELNNSQARMQNPSAIVSAGNNPQTSLLLPGELETLSVNNTRDNW